MRYQQLTEGRRYQISILLEEGFSANEIAKKLKCHRSTVYRELNRHKVKEAYCPDSAHLIAMGKRKAAQKYRIPQKRPNIAANRLESRANFSRFDERGTACQSRVDLSLYRTG